MKTIYALRVLKKKKKHESFNSIVVIADAAVISATSCASTFNIKL